MFTIFIVCGMYRSIVSSAYDIVLCRCSGAATDTASLCMRLVALFIVLYFYVKCFFWNGRAGREIGFVSELTVGVHAL